VISALRRRFECNETNAVIGAQMPTLRSGLPPQTLPLGPQYAPPIRDNRRAKPTACARNHRSRTGATLLRRTAAATPGVAVGDTSLLRVHPRLPHAALRRTVRDGVRLRTVPRGPSLLRAC